jgi:hypothetical protein
MTAGMTTTMPLCRKFTSQEASTPALIELFCPVFPQAHRVVAYRIPGKPAGSVTQWTRNIIFRCPGSWTASQNDPAFQPEGLAGLPLPGWVQI